MLQINDSGSNIIFGKSSQSDFTFFSGMTLNIMIGNEVALMVNFNQMFSDGFIETFAGKIFGRVNQFQLGNIGNVFLTTTGYSKGDF